MAKIITSNGIISSSAPINIKIGAASSSLYIDSGSIGIGTSTPDSALDIESGYITLPELAFEPETVNITPGKGALYLSGADSLIYFKNDLGDVYDLTKSGSNTATPGDGNYSVQFNSGSTFSGSQNLIYNYITNTLSGTTAQFTTITASNGFISGGLTVGNYIQMLPVGTLAIPANQTASYIYTSGSTNDLYFTQYQPGTNFTSTTRLRWLEGLLNTGLLHGGVLSTVNGTTSFNVTSGSGLIVSFNASTITDPYPTIKYVEWPSTISQSLPFTGSAEITYISIDNNGGILQSTTSPSLSQFKDRIFLGRILHQTGSVTNGAFNTPAAAYAVASNTADFIRAIGPLKISGHVLAASGSTLSLTKTAGDSYVEGRNYTNNPNIPNVISSADDAALTVSKIYREYISGSTTIIDTGIANAGYTTVDSAFYQTTAGTLGSVGPSEYTVQRVFWFPRSINRALFIYYGQNKYSNLNDAIDAVSTESFIEADNTKGSAILVGYIVLRGNALDLTNPTDARIFQAGIFRGSAGGGGGIGGATVPGDGNGSVQYNDSNTFGGDNGFTYNKSTNALFLSGNITSLTTISGTTGQFTTITGSFTGSGVGLFNLTASGISNFTNDVRSQFSAGTNITITSGVISAVTGGVGSPGGPIYSIQFNSGSTFTGSNTLTYDIPNSSLLGTNGQFSGYFIASQLTGNLSGTATDADKLDGLHASEFAQISQSNNFLANTIFTTLTASSAYISGDVIILGTASVSVLNTTTENTLQIADKYIVLASGSLGHEDLDGAGILWGTGGVGPTLGVNGEHAHVLFSNANDRLEVFPNLYVSGTFSSSDGISSSIGQFTTITASVANITQITGNVFGTSSYSSLSANSDLLDNLDSSVFAKTGSSNTFTATNTFTNNISGTTADFNSITAGTFNGNLNGTASNADLLDGIDSSEFAKLSSNNTFTGINTFNNAFTGTNAFFSGDVRINGTASISQLNTLNQTSLVVGDKYIIILSGGVDHASLDGSGIQWGSGAVGDPTQDNLGSNAHIRYEAAKDALQVFPGLYVTGGTGVLFQDNLVVSGSTTLTSLTASTAQISGGLSVDNFYFITKKSDLPVPVSGVITLANNATYYFIKDVDLVGDRLVCGQNTTLIGNSSENCRLKSTGLTSANPLITSQWSLPIRFMAIEAQYAIDLNASGNANQALDWIGVNFVNTPKVGTIKDYTNFIMTDSAFLDATGMKFDGSIGTIGFSQCLLNGFSSSLGSTTIELPNTLTITRRFRAIYTSFLALAGETAISSSTISSIPSEGFILDTINFSGGGTYLTGLTSVNNKALFINCVNITNTSTTGFLYDLNNPTNTTLTANVWAKVAGTTTAGALNSKFTHTDNRLTYTGAFTQNFTVTVCANAASVSNNQVLSVGVAKNGTIIAESEMTVRTATGGQDYPVSTQVTVQLAPNDFVEVFMRNTATSNARLTDFNMAVKKIPS